MQQKHQQRKTRRGWETAARWTLGAAGAILAVGAAVPTAAGAQSTQGPTASVLAGDEDPAGQQAPGGNAAREFHIAPGNLKDTLEAFRQATGMRIHYKMAVDQVESFRSAGVQGTYTPAGALHELLEKTGLSYQIEGGNTVKIAVRNAEQVDVQASAASIALAQFLQPLVDTAQTVSVVPQFIMQDQAATGLRDTLRDVPGISIAAGEGGAQGDTLTIRGFNARNDIFLDGIRDFGSYYRDSFDYQSVDVLEGPASVEFGRGSTGGVVNQESKTPELREGVTGTAQLGTNQMRRITADINERIHGMPGSAYRINLVGEQSMVADRRIVNTNRYGIAPSIAFGLNSKTRTTLSYLHESENDTPDYGLPYFGASVAPVSRSTYYGFVSDNYLKTNPDILTGKIEHDINPHLTVRNVIRWADYPRDVRITEPQVNTAGTLVYTNADGKNAYENAATRINVACAITAAQSTSCYPVVTDPSLVSVKRNQLVSQSVEDILWDQITTTANFNIGRVTNNAVVLLEGGRERSRPLRNGYTLPYAPLVNPNPYDPFAPTQVVQAVRTHVESQSYGVDLLDTVKVTQWLQMSGGVRFDYFDTQSATPYNPAAPMTASVYATRLDKQPTYRAAIVVKPTTAGSLYFDYGTSFNPSAESLSLSANNAVSPPEYNETFEVGAKWGLLRDRLDLNGSLFRTEKLNARETDPANSANSINVGSQLVRGVQIGALGHMPSSFDLILGYAYLDGRVESSAVNASPFGATTYNVAGVTQTLRSLMASAGDSRANQAPYLISPAGFPLANVPKNSANFFVTHKLRYGFVGGFGGNYVGPRRASSTSMIGLYSAQTLVDPAGVPLAFKAVSGYTLLNLMVRRPINERVDLQVNVNNLANSFFIDQPHPNHLVPGEGLNAQFGLNYKF